MPPADPPVAAPPPAERPARRKKRRPPKRDPHPATRLREASRYSVRYTVSLEADLHAELVRLAQASDITFPEAVRRAARIGVGACFRAIQEQRDEAEMDQALREFDPGSRSDPAADGAE